MKIAFMIAIFIAIAIILISRIAKKRQIDSEIEEDMGFFDGEAFLFDDDNSQHILMS